MHQLRTSFGSQVLEEGAVTMEHSAHLLDYHLICNWPEQSRCPWSPWWSGSCPACCCCEPPQWWFSRGHPENCSPGIITEIKRSEQLLAIWYSRDWILTEFWVDTHKFMWYFSYLENILNVIYPLVSWTIDPSVLITTAPFCRSASDFSAEEGFPICTN